MGDFLQKDGDGALFRNTDKEAEQQPDYKGSITVGGVQYWLSAWIKKSKAGNTYMSLSAQPKKAAKAAAPEPSPKFDAATPEFDDDMSKIPF